MKIKKNDLPKRRNSEVIFARTRKAGSHEKPYKTKRSKNKVSLKQEWF